MYLNLLNLLKKNFEGYRNTLGGNLPLNIIFNWNLILRYDLLFQMTLKVFRYGYVIECIPS